MIVSDLIEALKKMPQDEPVYRWNSEWQGDGTQTIVIEEADHMGVVALVPADDSDGFVERRTVRLVLR